MKKNKLFTVLAAITLFTSTSVIVENNNFNTTVLAAKKTTTAKVKVKSGARLYHITFNKKGTKVIRINLLKNKGRVQALRGGTFNAIWSNKYKGTNYYYIGNNGKTAWAVRTKDAKVIGKKRVPTITTFVKLNKAKAAKAQAKQKAKVDARKALAKQWQDKIDAAKPKSFTGKVNTETIYGTVGSDNKIQQANDKLSMGTNLTIIYKINDVFKGSSNNSNGYIAYDNDDKKTVLVPAAAVSLDNGSDADVLTQDQYSTAQKNVDSLYQQAKKALNIK